MFIMSWLIPLWLPFCPLPWLFQSFYTFFIYTTPPASGASGSCLEFCWKQNLSGEISLNCPRLCLRWVYSWTHPLTLTPLTCTLCTFLSNSSRKCPIHSSPYSFLLFPCIVLSAHVQVRHAQVGQGGLTSTSFSLVTSHSVSFWTNLERKSLLWGQIWWALVSPHSS